MPGGASTVHAASAIPITMLCFPDTKSLRPNQRNSRHDPTNRRKAPGNGNSVDALLETIDSLPLADPAVIRLCGSDHPVEVGGGAVVDVVPMVAQVQERLAVVTTIALKLIKRLKNIIKLVKFLKMLSLKMAVQIAEIKASSKASQMNIYAFMLTL